MDPTTARREPASYAVPATPGQLAWLRDQVDDWRAEGLIDPATAEAVLARYLESRRFSLGRLLLAVGTGFLGIGLIWLVAANLDELSPLTRFLAVVVLWLTCLVGAEVLDSRRTSAVVVGAVRTLAAFGVGAVIFQAAQSLQVPAYEPGLVGLWGLGALVQAYVTAARGPLLVAIAGFIGWVLWEAVEQNPTLTGTVLALTASAVAALGMAGLHERWLPAFSGPWRHVGAGLALGGLFVAGLPVGVDGGLPSFGWTLALVTAAGVLAAATCLVGPVAARWEVLGGSLALTVGVVLAAWPAGADSRSVGLDDLAHALVAVTAYVALSVGVAAVGTLRDAPLLSVTATLGLVLFTVVQSFAVFAPIVQGAWLFLLLGAILLAAGVGFDRARRHLAATLEQESDR
ncbi:DUF2157 domain-containing protein [Nocardioides campestrisoli]|uniref:DUF2157 domain-containing protein n=1 Tax=Nocardioides campestrisoli TaxID=2736757 RepID=UPI00163D6265|nr:DUF2157 domain-containing protein [Nocardioides campestrisoli]